MSNSHPQQRDPQRNPSPSGNRSFQLFAAGLGAVLVVAGVVAGFWPHGNGQMQGSLFADSCGSAFIPNPSAISGLVSCDAVLGQPRTAAIVLLVIGIIGLAVGLPALFGAQASSRRPTPVDAHTQEGLSSPNLATELERISALRAEGHLTEAEFTSAKARLLSE